MEVRIGAAVLLLMLVISQVKAQTTTNEPKYVRGYVQDSLIRGALEDATVSLVRLPRHTVLQNLRSSKNGFSLRWPGPGNYQVITSYLGYVTDTTTFTINAKDSISSAFIRIRLKRSVNPLMEVVVKATIPPAIIKNDTIAFNASSYPTRPYATVEDLLKKLPGIEVDRDGNVTMQGRKVDKIYLEGKEFFLNDVKTATQNLPADIVAQVEAFDTQTEQGRLSGIRDNTGGKTLNIKLKKDRKRGYFGKVYAGVGNDNSYSTGGTVTNLSANRWLFGAANTNNINNQFNGKFENNNGPGSGVQSFSTATFNYKDNWGKKLTATFNAGEDGSRNNLLQSSHQQTFLADSSLTENRFSQSHSTNTAYHLNGFLDYRIDSFSVLQYRTTWTPQKSSNESQDTVAIATTKPFGSYLSSRGQTDNTSTTDGYSFNNNLDFHHRFRKRGRSLMVGFTQSTQTRHQQAGLYSLVNAFDSAGNMLQQTLFNQRSGQNSNNDSYGGNFTYTEPLSPHHVLDFGYRISTSASRSYKQSFDYDSATGKYDIPDSLTTNRFFNRNTVQRLSAGYNGFEGKLKYQLGIATQLTNLLNDNYSLNSHLKQRFANWYPRANFIYNIARGKTLTFNYMGSSTAPTIDQLQPLPDLTNPFLVKLGNPNLQQQFNHSINADFSNFNTHTFRNWQLSVQGDYVQHQITGATNILAGGVQQVQYVNIEGVYHLSSSFAYGFPLGKKKGNGNIGLNGRYGHDISIVNGLNNVSKTLGIGGRLQMNYHPTSKLYIDGEGSFNYTDAHYSINTVQSTNTWSQQYGLDVSYELPFSIFASSSYDLQVTGSQGSLPSQQVARWNASLYKSLLRSRAAQIRLSIFDLLNTASSYTQTVGVNYVATSQTNLPGRLVLLSFIYHFRRFPPQTKVPPEVMSP